MCEDGNAKTLPFVYAVILLLDIEVFSFHRQSTNLRSISVSKWGMLQGNLLMHLIFRIMLLGPLLPCGQELTRSTHNMWDFNNKGRKEDSCFLGNWPDNSFGPGLKLWYLTKIATLCSFSWRLDYPRKIKNRFCI